MTNSINTNIAAYFAQANITAASQAATSSVARLSSGNAIVQASDNVAALATGTSIGTEVSVLKTAQTNASQGSSLLQVADGALAQIQSILQQQQSLALQAESGSLTDTDRGFLNQEFSALTNEINALAGSTTFNGVNLIDGSIAAAGTVGSTDPLVNKTADTSNSTAIIGAAAGFTDSTYTGTDGTGSLNYSGFTGISSATFTAAGTTITNPVDGNNDAALTGSIKSNANSGTGVFAVSLNGTIDITGTDSGATGTATSYNVSYTIGGVTYAGVLAANSSGTDSHDGTVKAGTTLTLTATTDPDAHAIIHLTVGSSQLGTSGAGGADINGTIKTGLDALFATAVGKSSGFVTTGITKATGGTNTVQDAQLYGDLSQGSFNVSANGAIGTTITSYAITYSLNGVTYTGNLGTSSTGSADVDASKTVTLQAADSSNHATINLKVGLTGFGTNGTTNQSDNIKDSLTANFLSANILSPTASATVSGNASANGVAFSKAVNDIGQNDTAFVGDLSQGAFHVSGSVSAGYTVSYTLNNATYQGSVTAAQIAAGHTLVLDSGSGSLAFTLNASAGGTDNATDFQAALTGVFSSATAYASHTVATTLATDSNGATIAGSAITSAATDGTLLDGFTGSDVTLQSALYTGGGSNLPPIANFSATGSGTSTVFSVVVDGTTYSTQGTVTDAGDLAESTFNSGAGGPGSTDGVGYMTFYKNGDSASNEQLQLNVANVTHEASITTTGDVANVVAALNSVFGSGGTSGGLNFQLGSTSDSVVQVNIGSATSTSLFGSTALDISTADGATAAATAVGAALNTITAARSGVGALESQFNFASAALQSSVQNQSAAQSGLLDTDIAAESTSYATEQVKLQAGISVLAQANQQLQNLLKLITA